MKVMDSSKIIPRLEKHSSDNSLKSKFSLKFTNRKQENDFQQAILSDISSSLGINHREKCRTHIYTYFGTITLYNSAYISSYFISTSSLDLLLFKSLILTLFSLLTFIILYIYLIKDRVSSSKSISLISSYFLTLILISFNISFTSSHLIQSSQSADFNTILGILPLIYSSKFTVFNTFLKYLLANSLVSLIFLILTLSSAGSIQRTILEFLFILFVVLLESHSFYIQEALVREKFVVVNNLILPDKKKNEDFSPKTDIEEITNMLKDCIHMLPMIGQKDKSRICAEKLFDYLTKVMNLLGNRNSVYSLDLEGLDNNIDNEDKIFLEQTCVQPRRSMARNSTKYLIRKTIDVLRNYEMQELVGLLKRIGKEWNFDIFFLKDCTQGKPLATTGSFCMQRYHLDSLFAIEQGIYEEFFAAIEQLYKPNPYHNSAHAADVLCSFMYLVGQSYFKDFIQDYEVLATVIAILGHDVAHPGLTNRFLINSKHPLSITYNDSSVLENMHCSTTFEQMQSPNKNLLHSLPKESALTVRSLIIEMILATDMAKHFDLVGKFKAKLACANFSFKHPEQRLEVLKIFTKASDVAHAGKNMELHQKWTNLVCDEFFAQGDLEKKLDLPVSMYCDRDKTDLPKSQIGFIKNIVFPIYECIHLCFESECIKTNCLDQLDSNMKMWESLANRKRVMTLSVDSINGHTGFKVRTETTLSGKLRNSIGSLLVNE